MSGDDSDVGEVLLHDVSPNGNIEAMVESDGRVIYLYLRASEDLLGFGLRPVWVRNLVPAPTTIDAADITAGRSPPLPKPYCRHPEGAEMPDRRNLRAVWLEEGDAVALMELGEVLAIVPSWAGNDGFRGYARDHRGMSPLAWELPDNDDSNSILGRVEQAVACWADWDADRVWTPFQKAALADIARDVGPLGDYFGINGEKWPPCFLAEVKRPDGIWLLTGGMALRPQPRVEAFVEDFRNVRRIELGLVVPHAQAELLPVFRQWLSGLASFPWTRWTWLGDGHTLPVPATDVGGRQVTKLSFAAHGDRPGGKPSPVRGDPVTRLWLELV